MFSVLPKQSELSIPLGCRKENKTKNPKGGGEASEVTQVKNKGEKDDVQIRKRLLSSCGAIPESVFVERMRSSAAESRLGVKVLCQTSRRTAVAPDVRRPPQKTNYCPPPKKMFNLVEAVQARLKHTNTPKK